MIAPAALASDVPLAVRVSLEEVNAKVLAGLDRASQLGVGRGYLEATAGVKTGVGAFGRLEVGARPSENVALFAYGQVTAPLPGTPPGWGPTAEAGVGARFTW